MRIIKNGNSAIVEYTECADPEFELSENGVLFIYGYSYNMAGHSIGAAKRFDTGLKGYKII